MTGGNEGRFTLRYKKTDILLQAQTGENLSR